MSSLPRDLSPLNFQRTFPGVEGKTLQLMGAHSYGDGCHMRRSGHQDSWTLRYWLVSCR